MKLHLIWQKPIPLEKDSGLIYTCDIEKIPDVEGVYIFARRWGKNYEALYVGQSRRLRSRIRGQLNNLKLMKYIDNAASGKRALIIGQPAKRAGKKNKMLLDTLERAFIRHFLSEGHDLANKQGVRIRRHEISSEGPLNKAFMPRAVYLEKRKGE